MRRDASEFGADACRNANNSIAGFIHRVPVAPANRGQNCRSVGRTFFSFDQFDFLSVDVGLNLAPELGTRSAAP